MDRLAPSEESPQEKSCWKGWNGSLIRFFGSFTQKWVPQRNYPPCPPLSPIVSDTRRKLSFDRQNGRPWRIDRPGEWIELVKTNQNASLLISLVSSFDHSNSRNQFFLILWFSSETHFKMRWIQQIVKDEGITSAPAMDRILPCRFIHRSDYRTLTVEYLMVCLSHFPIIYRFSDRRESIVKWERQTTVLLPYPLSSISCCPLPRPSSTTHEWTVMHIPSDWVHVHLNIYIVLLLLLSVQYYR